MSAVYPKAREILLSHFLAGTTPTGVGFFVLGVDGTYVYDSDHDTLTDIQGSSITIPEAPLIDEAVSEGAILSAANVALTDLANPFDVEALIVYAKWAGGSLLFAYITESSNASLPQIVDGDVAQITWADAGIFKL